jgi:hypothetical protein
MAWSVGEPGKSTDTWTCAVSRGLSAGTWLKNCSVVMLVSWVAAVSEPQVRIPMRFQRRGARKRIVAPDGSAIVPASKPQPNGTLVKALARAWRWQRLLDNGVYASVSDIGHAEKFSKSYVSRILRLALLAPDIFERILAGAADRALALEKLERPLPASWEEQRACILEPNASLAV